MFSKHFGTGIKESENGPQFGFPIQGKGSKGIDHMQIFCLDMALMILNSEKNQGPKFLIHDSHLFDGVDERQVGKALSLGFKLANKYGFQYLVTMNSDDLPKLYLEFDFSKYILKPILTDEGETGGLLGLRLKTMKKEPTEEESEDDLEDEE